MSRPNRKLLDPKPALYAVAIAEDHLPALDHLATLAFGAEGFTLEALPDLPTARGRCYGDRVLLLLGSPSQSQLDEAQAAQDEEQLPLWAVVAYGATPATGSIVSLSESEPMSEAVAALLRLALENHILRRQSERARGDLLTLSTRVCHDLRSPFNTLQTAVHLLVSKDLSPSYPREEISKPAMGALAQQNRLIARVSLVTESSGKAYEPGPVALDQAFSAALDKTRQSLEDSGGSIKAPERWPDGVLGVQSWIEAMWEAMILTLLGHRDSGFPLTAGWQEQDDHLGIDFWIRCPYTGSNWDQNGIKVIPFNLLHQFRDSRDLGPPIVHRLAQLQGGCSWIDLAHDGQVEFAFSLPRRQ